ncbi:YgjP-like metallopeptidase domain-containing protein [Kitasatospora sp. NPDC001540]|uniref:YgjP-like metallopeptidase domain-containing protein n=1 Tax=Kitasatospora sp. NPDC001540 TaxID=3364014 RepID=UPI0036A71305
MSTEPTTDLATRVAQAIAADGALAEGSYSVVLSRRRRASVDTLADGRHVVRILATSTPEKIAKFIRDNRATLEEHARRNREAAPRRPALRLEDGEIFQLLGQPSVLRLSPSPALATDGPVMLLPRADLDRRGVHSVIDWYRDFGLAWMNSQAPALWSRLAPQGPLPTLAVRDLGKRREGLFEDGPFRVTLHWRIFQLDARLVEYALAHELAHAARPAGPSHGPRFWRCLESALPDARARHRDLLAEARTLWTGDIA